MSLSKVKGGSGSAWRKSEEKIQKEGEGEALKEKTSLVAKERFSISELEKEIPNFYKASEGEKIRDELYNFVKANVSEKFVLEESLEGEEPSYSQRPYYVRYSVSKKTCYFLYARTIGKDVWTGYLMDIDSEKNITIFDCDSDEEFKCTLSTLDGTVVDLIKKEEERYFDFFRSSSQK